MTDDELFESLFFKLPLSRIIQSLLVQLCSIPRRVRIIDNAMHGRGVLWNLKNYYWWILSISFYSLVRTFIRTESILSTMITFKIKFFQVDYMGILVFTNLAWIVCEFIYFSWHLETFIFFWYFLLVVEIFLGDFIKGKGSLLIEREGIQSVINAMHMWGTLKLV